MYLIHQASCREGDISVQPSPCTAANKNCELHWMRNCQKEKKAHTDRTTYFNRFGSTVDGLTTGQMSCGRQRGVANHWAMNDVNCWHLVSGWAFDGPENVRMERNVKSVKIQAIYWQCHTHLSHIGQFKMERNVKSVKIQAIYWQCNTHLSHMWQLKMETNVNSVKIQAIYWPCNTHLSHMNTREMCLCATEKE